jgi:MFS family permease
LADKIGRKWTLLSSTVFFAVSYVLLATTSSVAQIYVGRLLQGMGVGFVMTVQTMYIGEISTDESRGALGKLTKPIKCKDSNENYLCFQPKVHSCSFLL